MTWMLARLGWTTASLATSLLLAGTARRAVASGRAADRAG